MKKIHLILSNLGLKNYENHLFAAAASDGYELMKNPRLKKGQFTDCVYFVFVNNELFKIGKVGGGSRCMDGRVNDYRSTDPLGVLIKESIREGNDIQIFFIDFPPIEEEHFGIKTKGSVKGPVLEKELIEKAIELGYPLPWNKNKG